MSQNCPKICVPCVSVCMFEYLFISVNVCARLCTEAYLLLCYVTTVSGYFPHLSLAHRLRFIHLFVSFIFFFSLLLISNPSIGRGLKDAFAEINPSPPSTKPQKHVLLV